MVIGHETAGTVAEVGDGVRGLAVGDRVALEPGEGQVLGLELGANYGENNKLSQERGSVSDRNNWWMTGVCGHSVQVVESGLARAGLD